MTTPCHTPADISPCLTYADAGSAIDWLCRVFGFTKRLVVVGANETIMHSELSFGTSVVMVSSPKPEFGRYAPQSSGGGRATLSVFVADPDAHHARVIAAGAYVVQPLRDEDYGSRGYLVEDLEGHYWYFGTYRPGAHWTSA